MNIENCPFGFIIFSYFFSNYEKGEIKNKMQINSSTRQVAGENTGKRKYAKIKISYFSSMNPIFFQSSSTQTQALNQLEKTSSNLKHNTQCFKFSTLFPQRNTN